MITTRKPRAHNLLIPNIAACTNANHTERTSETIDLQSNDWKRVICWLLTLTSIICRVLRWDSTIQSTALHTERHLNPRRVVLVHGSCMMLSSKSMSAASHLMEPRSERRDLTLHRLCRAADSYTI